MYVVHTDVVNLKICGKTYKLIPIFMQKNPETKKYKTFIFQISHRESFSEMVFKYY